MDRSRVEYLLQRGRKDDALALLTHHMVGEVVQREAFSRLPLEVEIPWRKKPVTFRLQTYSHDSPLRYTAFYEGKEVGHMAFTLGCVEGLSLIVTSFQGKRGADASPLKKKGPALLKILSEKMPLFMVNPSYNYHISLERIEGWKAVGLSMETPSLPKAFYANHFRGGQLTLSAVGNFYGRPLRGLTPFVNLFALCEGPSLLWGQALEEAKKELSLFTHSLTFTPSGRVEVKAHR